MYIGMHNIHVHKIHALLNYMFMYECIHVIVIGPAKKALLSFIDEVSSLQR